MEDDLTKYDDLINCEDCPAKYLERLKSMLNYTGGGGVADLLTQRQTPEEWLGALTKLNFADPASVLNLRFDLIEHNVGEFILCTGKDALTVWPDPGTMIVEDTPIVDRDGLHEVLMTLESFRRSEALPASADEKALASSPVCQTLPSVVLPIGRLRKGHTTESGILDTNETDYVLVVDAITPGHPVWLIWDRLACHEDGVDYVHPNDLDPVFKGVGKNFDAAQILPSIKDWLESYGNLDFNQLEESIKATGLVGFVKAKEATLAYVTELLDQAQSQLATDTMENEEVSEARYAEIKEAAGDPFEVSPSVYMQKLQEATARDNSLKPFLARASKVDTTPPQSPLEWLRKLFITDFTNVVAICSHRLALTTDNIERFNLVANDEDTFAVGRSLGGLSYDELEGDVHPVLLSLESSALLGADDSLPALVFPVGQLLKKRNGDSKTSHWSETDYVLVVDAIAPGHPVWLIYDRNPLDEMGERDTVDPDHQPLIFKGIGHNFDVAKIFPSVHGWIQSYGNVDFAQFEETIKATCTTGAVRAKLILLSEAEVLLRQ
ncbi:hypothetical protein H9Q72_005464 [Fusarium xylarioides]|uniref:Uncharacterized protein n=1 Tax=Fusarium xylarioides TaxID=221167 RepID=A0A9P7L6P2_9HYPO|nr:hypothetical protein H9Q72_005464 [Fusarium xylarioides]